MKLDNVLAEGGMADIPPVLIDKHTELYHRFKRMAPGLDEDTRADLEELFQNCDDDMYTGDVGFVEETLDEIESLL